jgi:hypothetical protein
MAWPAPQTTPLAGTPQQLHHRCESGQFQFETTQELVGLMPSHGIWAGATPLVNSSDHRRVKKNHTLSFKKCESKLQSH